jgi:hypothetical protein
MDESSQQDQIVYGRRKKSEMKKIWEKPKLIILLKGRPEELVLANCKGSNFTGGRANRNNGCKYLICLAPCSAFGTS